MSAVDRTRFDQLISMLAELSEDNIDALALGVANRSRGLTHVNCQDMAAMLPDLWRAVAIEMLELWSSGAGPDAGEDLATLLRVAGMTARRIEERERIEVAWSGPPNVQGTFRRTDLVWTDVVGEADRSLWIASYSSAPTAQMEVALAAALDRGVSVKIIVERTEDNAKFDGHGLARLSNSVRDRAVFLCWPRARRVEIAGENGYSAMHAKCVIADRRIAFVTSANLSKSAMEHNIEVGVVIRGGDQPARLAGRFEDMANRGELERFTP